MKKMHQHIMSIRVIRVFYNSCKSCYHYFFFHNWKEYG